MSRSARRWATALAWANGLLTATLLVSGLLLLLRIPANRYPSPATFEELYIFVNVVFAAVGLVIVTRHPENRVGWLVCATGLTGAIWPLADIYVFSSVLGGRLPAVEWVAWLLSWGWLLGSMFVFVLLPLLFPDGKPPSPRWRGLVVWAALALLLYMLEKGFEPWTDRGIANPLGVSWVSRFVGLQVPLVVALAIPIVGSLAAVVIKFRRGDAVERQQLKWFSTAMVGVGLAVLPSLALNTDVPSEPLPFAVLTVLLILGVPVSIGIAILRYRLYDIDVVINRALVYGALAAFITAIYVGIVVGIGTLVGSRGQADLALSIAATAVVALAFQPVRERIERLANRLVYGHRATPYEVLAQFSHRVAGAYANEEVLLRLARVLGEGTGAASASVWIHTDGHGVAAATWPAAAEPVVPESADRVAVVRHQGEALGNLAVKKRRGEPVTPVEEKLLADLAAQAGQVLRNVSLTADLQARLQEISAQASDLRVSRQRIVAAQDSERRRLERNIHDGAQQHLVALAVKLRLTAALVRRDAERARPSIDDLRRQTRDGLETLRALAAGLNPPVLRERGIGAALAAQTALTTVPVEAIDNVRSRYPEDLEAAVYFCCQEAIQNAVKHAHASRITVRLGDQDGALTFTVSDDGTGFDPSTARRGAGMQNMADRIAAAGGVLEVVSREGKGAIVSGRIPLAVAVG